MSHHIIHHVIPCHIFLLMTAHKAAVFLYYLLPWSMERIVDKTLFFLIGKQKIRPAANQLSPPASCQDLLAAIRWARGTAGNPGQGLWAWLAVTESF